MRDQLFQLKYLGSPIDLYYFKHCSKEGTRDDNTGLNIIVKS